MTPRHPDHLEEAKRFYAAASHWSFNDYGQEYAGIRSPGGESGVWAEA